MFKIFGYLKNSIPQVLLIIVLLIIQAWGDLTLPQYTSDIVDIGIQNGGIKDAAAGALTVDGYNALKVFMNDEQKSVLEKSYKLVSAGNGTDEQKNMYPASKSNDVFFLNDLDNEEKQALIAAVKSPMTAAEMLSELSFSEFSAMVEKQGITLPFTSYELAGERSALMWIRRTLLLFLSRLRAQALWTIPIYPLRLTNYRICRELLPNNRLCFL